MKLVLVILFIAYAFCEPELVVTREYVNYLKSTVVDWEVEDYESNIFKGWTIEDAKNFLGLTDFSESLDSLPSENYGTALPSAYSWAGAACDHPVANQGACGSCWAFATTQMLSDRCCIQATDKGWLSPQELVSCDQTSYGCYGGSITTSVTYIRRNGGLVTDDCFPYLGQSVACPTKCRDGSDWRAAHTCRCNVPVNCYGEMGIKSCLMKGPTTIGFQVCQSFMSYKSGIYKCDCDKFIGGHAVLAMGFSDTPRCNYLAKNSWGTSWGIKGYFNIECSTCNLYGGPSCTKITA